MFPQPGPSNREDSDYNIDLDQEFDINFDFEIPEDEPNPENMEVDPIPEPPEPAPPEPRIPTLKNKATAYKDIYHHVRYHNIFGNNLLRRDGANTTCECTPISYYNKRNPFLKEMFMDAFCQKVFSIYTNRYKNVLNRHHTINFYQPKELNYILTSIKPTIYVKECVTAFVACKYTIKLNLIKNNIYVGKYLLEHTFTESGEKQMELIIENYNSFDQIDYFHTVTMDPKIQLRLGKAPPLKLGISLLTFVSNKPWFEPKEKVIVVKIEPPPDDLPW